MLHPRFEGGVQAHLPIPVMEPDLLRLQMAAPSASLPLVAEEGQGEEGEEDQGMVASACRLL